jgi:hypothetical protein
VTTRQPGRPAKIAGPYRSNREIRRIEREVDRIAEPLALLAIVFLLVGEQRGKMRVPSPR